MPSATSIIISVLSFGITGTIAGVLATQFFAGRRDKKQRKASFLGFLAAWETKADSDSRLTFVSGLPIGLQVNRTMGPVARDFTAKRIELNEKARLLEPNYRGSKLDRFQRLTKAVADMPLGEVDKDAKQLLGAVRDLAEFVERS
jgi:hypothetical protein